MINKIFKIYSEKEFKCCISYLIKNGYKHISDEKLYKSYNEKKEEYVYIIPGDILKDIYINASDDKIFFMYEVKEFIKSFNIIEWKVYNRLLKLKSLR